MTITVTDFERITGISRHTVYAWFYRNKFPEGIEPVKTLGNTKLITVKKSSEHYQKVNRRS